MSEIIKIVLPIIITIIVSLDSCPILGFLQPDHCSGDPSLDIFYSGVPVTMSCTNQFVPDIREIVPELCVLRCLIIDIYLITKSYLGHFSTVLDFKVLLRGRDLLLWRFWKRNLIGDCMPLTLGTGSVDLSLSLPVCSFTEKNEAILFHIL